MWKAWGGIWWLKKKWNKITNHKSSFHFFFYSYTNSAYLKIQFIECMWFEQLYFQVALTETPIPVNFWSIYSGLTAAPAVFSLSFDLTARCGHTKRLMGDKRQTQHGQNRKDGVKQLHLHVQTSLYHTPQNHSRESQWKLN